MHPLPQRRNWGAYSPEDRLAYVTFPVAQPAQPLRRWDWHLMFDEAREVSDLVSSARHRDAAQHEAGIPTTSRLPAVTHERRGNEAAPTDWFL